MNKEGKGSGLKATEARDPNLPGIDSVYFGGPGRIQRAGMGEGNGRAEALPVLWAQLCPVEPGVHLL